MFFELESPPPPLPQLTAETSLLFHLNVPQLLADEEILDPPNIRRGHLSIDKETLPIDCRDAGVEVINLDLESQASLDTPIAKPDGEAGRPGRGGYNLQSVLARHGWSGEEHESLKVVLFSFASPSFNHHFRRILSTCLRAKALMFHRHTLAKIQAFSRPLNRA